GPNSSSQGLFLIENIPVEIDIQSSAALAGHSLILSAYKPAGQGMSQPELIGQSRIILTGLPGQLGLVIAVPEPVTRDLDFVVIDGVIVDRNNQEIMVARQEQFYRGRDSAQLEMIQPDRIAPPPTGQSPSATFQQLEGKVYLPKNAPSLMRGASMTVELIETETLPDGSRVENILGQSFVDIDQENSPFKFKMDYSLPLSSSGAPRYLRAVITDWAGRSVYETLAGEPYLANVDSYRLDLQPSPMP
ncbi:MAG: hypothetical protein HKN36_06350, partial [Hellea sp.]|nr:hypothetical protein [Hellea sp.]